MGLKQNPTVLIVERNDLVRSKLVEMLKGGNFAVFNRGSPDAALALAIHGEKFDLLVTALSMPDMDGEVLANRLRAMGNPDMNVLYLVVSESDDLARANRLHLGGETVLVQPVGIATFQHYVSRMLR